jgi:hypothetical protein
MGYLIIGLIGLALGEAIMLDLETVENKIIVVKKARDLK